MTADGAGGPAAGAPGDPSGSSEPLASAWPPGSPASPSWGGRRVVVVVLLGVILLAAVAVGARAAPAGASVAPSASGALGDGLYGVLGVAAGAVVAMLVAATIFGVFRRRSRVPDARERERPARPIYVLLFIGGFALAVVWLLARAPRLKYRAAPSIAAGGVTAPSTAVAAGPPPSSPTVLLVGVVVGVLLIVAGGLVLLIRASSRHAPPLPLPHEPSPLLGAIDAALDALDSDADPRRAVIAAYATMERLLAAAGSPRRPADAPTEHLERSLLLLGSGRTSARRLTELFERARFSVQAIDEQVRRSAFEALVAVRRDLEQV